MPAIPSLAASQVYRISQLCEFLDNPHLQAAIHASTPLSMPQAVGSMGFDEPLWIGLGLVGLWAVLDASLERSRIASKCKSCGRATCIVGRLNRHPHAQAMPMRSMEELEDLRHLYAHNFAGSVDVTYTGRRRHLLSGTPPIALSCGVSFAGESLNLPASALKYYANCVSETLTALQQ